MSFVRGETAAISAASSNVQAGGSSRTVRIVPPAIAIDAA
jgi:hypothetical protein